MSYGLSDYGEEFNIRKTYLENLGSVTSVEIGLYDDSTDALTDSDDVGALSTEPSGSAYSRISMDFGSADFTAQMPSSDVEAIIADHDFDLSDDSSGSVDSYVCFITFNANIVGDDSAQVTHLVARGALEQSYTLDSVDTLNNNSSGVSLD